MYNAVKCYLICRTLLGAVLRNTYGTKRLLYLLFEENRPKSWRKKEKFSGQSKFFCLCKSSLLQIEYMYVHAYCWSSFYMTCTFVTLKTIAGKFPRHEEYYSYNVHVCSN